MKDTLFFTNENEDKAVFESELQKTVNALKDAFDTSLCYKGETPDGVKRAVKSVEILPDKGLGFDSAL